MCNLIAKSTSYFIIACILIVANLQQCTLGIKDSEWSIEQAIDTINEVLKSNNFSELKIDYYPDYSYTVCYFDVNENIDTKITFFYGGDVPESILYKITVDGKEPKDKSEVLRYILADNPILMEISDAVSQKSFDKEKLLSFEKEFIDTFNDDFMREGTDIPLRSVEYCKYGELFPDCHISVRYIDAIDEPYHCENIHISGYIK